MITIFYDSKVCLGASINILDITSEVVVFRVVMSGLILETILRTSKKGRHEIVAANSPRVKSGAINSDDDRASNARWTGEAAAASKRPRRASSRNRRTSSFV